jgi:hypothetical protein
MSDKSNTTDKIKESISRCGAPNIQDSSVTFPISNKATLTLVNKGEVVVYLNGKPITALVDPDELWNASEKMIKSLQENTKKIITKIDNCNDFKQTNSSVDCRFDKDTILRIYREVGDELFAYLNGNNINNIVFIDDVWAAVLRNLQTKEPFKYQSLLSNLDALFNKEIKKNNVFK